MKFILKASNKAFLEEFKEDKLIITSDPEKAKEFDRFGDAMAEAVEVNDVLDSSIFKVIPTC